MKNSLLVLVAFLSVLLISCSNDGDEQSEDNNSIIGVWKTISVVDVCADGTKSTVTLSSCEQKGRITFFENGTVSIIGYSEQNNNCKVDYDHEGTWVKGNNTLTLSWDYGEVDKPTIFELSNSTLNIGYYDSSANCANGKGSHWYTHSIRVN